MYCPEHFEQRSIQEMHALIRTYPLATLIMQTSQGIRVNHIPMRLSAEAEPHGVLSGHMPKSNSVWQEHDTDSPAIAVFHGPQAYITPSWYVSTKRHGKVVPTWNYTTVHAHGRVNVIQDRSWLMSHLEQLTDQMESSFEQPWSVSDAPKDYTDKLVEHLVGIEILIDRLEGKWKVSQNRPTEDRAGVSKGLKDDGGAEASPMSELVVPKNG